MGVLTAAVCLLAAVGVGCRPVISPLNDAKVECIIQETLNGDGSQHECGPQLAAELDEVQRHQGLLGELQRLADDERERYEYNRADEKGDLEPKDEDSNVDKTVGDDLRKREMDEPKIDARGIHDEEERAKELEELLAEEISKKGKEERNDEELKELLRELKKKRYEMKERGSPKSRQTGQEDDDTKQKMARDKEVQQQSVADQKKDELELSVEKDKVEKELKELTSKNKPEEEKVRKEKQEELDELVKKMQRVQDEKRDDGVDQNKLEKKDKTEGDNGGGENQAGSKEGAVEVKEPQQKRVMEKASDEATRQFERERLKDQEEDSGPHGEDEEDEDDYVREDEDDDEGGLEDDEGEELLEIEAQLREVAAELRELRRG